MKTLAAPKLHGGWEDVAITGARPAAGDFSRPAETASVQHCIACECKDASKVYPAQIPWLRRCKSCGLARVEPAPTAEELAAVYDANYFRTFGHDPANESQYRRLRAETSDLILAIAERRFACGNLLDIGSGLGDLLAVAMHRGWDPVGIEPNPWAREYADRISPRATRTCELDEFEGPEAGFDLITCVDVIEHLRRPDHALQKFFSWLRPGAGLILTTPDLGSSLAYLMGANWPHFHIDHLWYFNRATLTAVVQRAGFEVLTWRRAPKVFNLAYILGIFEHNCCSSFVRRLAAASLRYCPLSALSMPWPAVREGQLLIARRPLC